MNFQTMGVVQCYLRGNHVFTILSVWYRADSCLNTGGFLVTIHVFEGLVNLFNTSIYSTTFIIPWKICNLLVPWTEIAPQTINFLWESKIFLKPIRIKFFPSPPPYTCWKKSDESTSCKRQVYSSKNDMNATKTLFTSNHRVSSISDLI